MFRLRLRGRKRRSIDLLSQSAYTERPIHPLAKEKIGRRLRLNYLQAD
jgi:hypothetical protein